MHKYYQVRLFHDFDQSLSKFTSPIYQSTANLLMESQVDYCYDEELQLYISKRQFDFWHMKSSFPVPHVSVMHKLK